MRNQIINSYIIVGTSVFFLAFCITLLSSIFFIFNYTISAYIFVVSFLASLGYSLILAKILLLESGRKNYMLYIIISFVLIMIISACIANAFYDISYDGQWYHQRGVYHLANNWNPFKEKVAVYQYPSGEVEPNDIWGNVWVDSYPKAPWIYAASIYKLTGNIEVGKTFNIAFILGSFLLSTAVVLSSIKKTNLTYAHLIGFIAAFNPVSIYQSLSFYVDGQLSSLLVSLASILYLFIFSSRKTLYSLLAIPFFTILVNVKFTGLVYSLITIVLLNIYLFLYSSKKVDCYRFIIASGLSLIIAIAIIGYNPYITNIQFHGHPFYPLAGKGSIDSLKLLKFAGIPIELANKNPVHSLLISIFSKLEVPIFVNTDARIGGFGTFFSLLFILGTFLTVFLLTTRIPNKRSFLAAIIILWLTVIANPAMWWARYVPQLWLFPLFAAVFALTSPSYKKILHLLVKSIITIALANILFIGIFYAKTNFYGSNQMVRILSDMSKISKFHPPVLINNSHEGLVAPQIRLQDHKINYKVVDTDRLSCSNPEHITSSDVLFCLSSK